MQTFDSLWTPLCWAIPDRSNYVRPQGRPITYWRYCISYVAEKGPPGRAGGHGWGGGCEGDWMPRLLPAAAQTRIRKLKDWLLYRLRYHAKNAIWASHLLDRRYIDDWISPGVTETFTQQILYAEITKNVEQYMKILKKKKEKDKNQKAWIINVGKGGKNVVGHQHTDRYDTFIPEKACFVLCKGTLEGNVITFSPAEGHTRGHFTMFYLA